MDRKTIATTTGGLLLLAAGVIAGRALATGAPQQSPLTYAGTVADQTGKPFTTAQNLLIKFWDAPNGGALKCTSPQTQAEANSGRFQVTLPPECVQAIHECPDVWSEVTVGPEKLVLPRVHVGAAPYALEAEAAKQALTAAGASGGLKTELDALKADLLTAKADIAAMKTASGGGPWVVDATGAQLGKLVSIDYISPSISCSGSSCFPLSLSFTHAVKFMPTDRLALITSKGYFLKVLPDGTFDEKITAYLASDDCSGKGVTLSMNISNLPASALLLLNRHAFWTDLGFFVPDGAPNATTAETKSITYKSYTSATSTSKCSLGTGTFPGIPVQPISFAELGLPATIKAPLTVTP